MRLIRLLVARYRLRIAPGRSGLGIGTVALAINLTSKLPGLSP